MAGKKPVIYVRYNIPEKYLNKIKALGATVLFEPWTFGKEEPQLTHDLSECNIVLTLGLNDPLTIQPYAPNLQWVQSMSVGLDALLHKETINSDIIITNTKGCTSIPIAEHTVAMISAFSRGLPTMLRNQHKKIWSNTEIKDLEGSNVGIVGYGEIGKEIAKRCKALGMYVVGCRKRPSNTLDNDPADQVVGLERIDEVIKNADFLILALPSTKETYHFIDKHKLRLLKESAFLINIGRGNTIVEEDLLQALYSQQIKGAALDVFDIEPLPGDHPFWELDNVIISPHNAYYSPRSMERYMDIFIENLTRFIEGKELLNVVNKELGY
ncbi:D-2-hydroxyacid dehydrogenase [Niallia taxi]|uniref:D-2-hydroxyacid dehydrogenase n=1 Tax=Niallia taxi TaxID=2499688 RepID=UPI002E1FBE08|nr:D-2-hydroxyacid dehydrogenase [Niallia taxi]